MCWLEVDCIGRNTIDLVDWMAMIESASSVQWLRRYKLFFFAGLLLLAIQLFLGYLLPIFGTSDDIYNPNSASIYSNLIEVRNAYKNQAAFDELFHDESLAFDDEDISNGNSIVNFKELTTGLVLPKIVVASSAKGGINNHHQFINNNNNNKHKNNNNPNDIRLNGKDSTATITNSQKLSTTTNLNSHFKFKPICEIFAKEAISAIYRAQTHHCKEIISNTTCAIQSGTFYPSTLPNYCPHEPYHENQPLGCFKDDKKFRTLSGYYINFKTTNTPTKCIQLCLQSGFVYAGVQYS